MFYFAPSGSYRTQDPRLSVHDCGGVSILNGKGELIWRPLINPKRVEYSAFTVSNLKGFGLCSASAGQIATRISTPATSGARAYGWNLRETGAKVQWT